VFVITNGVKPYQPATATGPGGPADYSKWNFVLTPKYTTIKQGPNNKITSKYTCTGRNSATTSFYSVNITGIQATTAASKQHEQQTTAAATTNTSAEGKKMPASMSSISHGADPLQPARLAYLGVPHTPHYSINTSVDQSVSITKPEFDPHIFPNIIVPFG
jgi:hypothetical protein